MKISGLIVSTLLLGLSVFVSILLFGEAWIYSALFGLASAVVGVREALSASRSGALRLCAIVVALLAFGFVTLVVWCNLTL